MLRAFSLAFLTLLPFSLRGGYGNDYARSVVRVHVTAQNWDVHRPWQKGPTSGVSSFGVVLEQKRVLVLGTTVANAAFIELELLGSGAKSRAHVTTVDYLANLALLQCEDEQFLSDMKPVSLLRRLKDGASCDVVQFQNNDEVEVNEGRLETTEVAPYPAGVKAFLIHRIKVDLGGTFANGMAPMFRRGKLAGLMIGYGEAQKIGVAIPPPVIQHFLDDLQDGTYAGFPEARFGSVSLFDPALRRYVGLADDQSGLFITTVIPGNAADAAGLQPGDVLTAINNYNVDKRGEYRDPDYGRIHIAHLISCRHFAGDKMEFHIVRQGQNMILPVTLTAVDTKKWPVEPFLCDEPPPFMVTGGLVMQELSMPFFAVWGNDWENNAPRHLTRLLRNQWDIAGPEQKFVILSTVLPSPFTMGYENLGMKQLVKVNGLVINNLNDVATALNSPVAGFHHFEFADSYPGEIVLAAGPLPQVDAAIQRAYSLPLLRRLR